jgi:ribosomal protein S18 acetylase RimI-like enzyme
MEILILFIVQQAKINKSKNGVDFYVIKTLCQIGQKNKKKVSYFKGLLIEGIFFWELRGSTHNSQKNTLPNHRRLRSRFEFAHMATGEPDLSRRLITYREAVEDDLAFLYGLHRAAMQRYVEETWGDWDEDWQLERFTQRFQPLQQRLIQINGQDVGVIEVFDRTEEVFIANIAILPEHQKQGVGSQVIVEIIEKADAQNKPVALRVLKVNLAARALYQRLGFGVTGETDTHYVMAREPSQLSQGEA